MAKVRKAKYLYQDGVYYEIGGGGNEDEILARINNMILVQDDEPTTPYNKIWIKETDTPVEIPEMSDIADFVSFAEDQTARTDAEKAQARANINAARPWKLVWENASPYSDFAEQDVTVDLADAEEVIIFCRHDTSQGIWYENHFKLSPDIDTADGQGFMITIVPTKIYQRYNNVFYRSKIHFATGAVLNSYGTRTNGAGYVIPKQIYAR